MLPLPIAIMRLGASMRCWVLCLPLGWRPLGLLPLPWLLVSCSCRGCMMRCRSCCLGLAGSALAARCCSLALLSGLALTFSLPLSASIAGSGTLLLMPP